MLLTILSVLFHCISVESFNKSINTKAPRLPTGCVYKTPFDDVYCTGVVNWTNTTRFSPKLRRIVIDDVAVDETLLSQVLKGQYYLKTLVLSKTAITSLTGDMFNDLHSLEELQLLADVNLVTTDPMALVTLKYLKRFRMTYSAYVSLNDIFLMFKNANFTKLRTLWLDSIGFSTEELKICTRNFVRTLRYSPLSRAVLTNLGLQAVESRLTPFLQHLKCLNFQGNTIVHSKDIAELEGALFLRNLRSADVSFQGIYTYIPASPYDLHDDCFEPLSNSSEITVLDNEDIKKTVELYEDMSLCPLIMWIDPNIRFLYAHDLYKGTSFNEQPFCLHYSNQLRYIDVSNNHNLSLPIIGALRLEYVNAMNTNMYYLAYHTVSHAYNVKTALFGWNELGAWISEGNATFGLRNAKSLASLDLSNNKITHISRYDLQFFVNIPFMNISGNKIQAQTLDVDLTLGFTLLNLTDNAISYLPLRFRQAFDNLLLNGGTHMIHLEDNPLQCDCDTVDFLAWFQAKVSNFHRGEVYDCEVRDTSEGKQKLVNIDVEKLRRQCSPTITKTIIISVTVSGVSVLVIMTMLVYRYHRVLRYGFFLMYLRYETSRLARRGYQLLINRDFTTDVYVVSSYNDRHFVSTNLEPQLLRRDLTLCIGENFLPGVSITDSIVEAMKICRVALLLVTPSFIDSQWCDFEITWALILKRKVIVIDLDDPPFRKMPPSLMYLYRRQTRACFPYSTDGDINEDVIERFWDRVNDSIREMNERNTAM